MQITFFVSMYKDDDKLISNSNSNPQRGRETERQRETERERGGRGEEGEEGEEGVERESSAALQLGASR